MRRRACDSPATASDLDLHGPSITPVFWQGSAAFARLLGEVQAEGGFGRISTFCRQAAAAAAAAAGAAPPDDAARGEGGEQGPPCLLTAAMAAQLVATQQQFDQVEAAVR